MLLPIFIVCCIVGTTIYFKAVKPFLNLFDQQALGASPVMLQRVEALFKAIEALTTDVNDH